MLPPGRAARPVLSEAESFACCPRPTGNRTSAGVQWQHRQHGGAEGGAAVIEEVQDGHEGDLPRAQSNHQPLVEEPDDAGTHPGPGVSSPSLVRILHICMF